MEQSISFSTAKTLVGERGDVLILKMQAWCASVSVGRSVSLSLSLSLSLCPFRPLSQLKGLQSWPGYGAHAHTE